MLQPEISDDDVQQAAMNLMAPVEDKTRKPNKQVIE